MQIFSTSGSAFLDNRPFRTFLGRLIAPIFLVSALVLGSLGVPSPTQAQPQKVSSIQAQDLYRMQEVLDVQLSPHGRSVAYTVCSVASPPPRSTRFRSSPHTQLYVTRTTGPREPRLLTRDERDNSQPAWHPEGTHLAFVRPVEGTPQVFVLSLNGGEPYQLTNIPHGAQRPQWSPNGERLLFASDVPESAVQRRTGRPAPSERPGRMPHDLTRAVPPDTLLVLRHAQTLDPVDTLALRPDDRPGLRTDTSRALRTPKGPNVPDSLAKQPIDSLALLPPDSLHAVFDRLRLRPDTTTVPVAPDTTATPNGNLVQVRRWLNQNRRQKIALVTSRLDLQGEHSLQPSPTYRHHFVVDVPSNIRSGSPPRPKATPVTHGYRSFGRAEWLPGGGQLVVSGTPPTTRHPDRVQQRNLHVVDLHRKQIQRLLRIENYALTNPSVTADGTTIAFRARSLSSTSNEQSELGLFALDGRSQPRFITSEFDRDVASLQWSPNGWYLYATASSGGGVPLYRFTPFGQDTSQTDARERGPSMTEDQPTSRDEFAFDSSMVRPADYEQMTAESRAVHSFDVTDAATVYATTDPATPSALYTNTVSFNNERKLAAPNADWLSRRRLASRKRITISHDSLEITGGVTLPVWQSDSLKHPWYVQVRGGPPELSSSFSPESWFEHQYLAGRGFGLLEVLPRGSAGFGRAYLQANDQNWGPGPAKDVLALVDSVATLPWSDSTQVAVGGTSYGGTLATWLLGQTDRFEAAVALNGIYDLPALLDEGHAWRLVPEEFGGYPWDPPPSLATDTSTFSVGLFPSIQSIGGPRAALHYNSPITYADLIDTPLLLLHGRTDRQVGLSQSERLYKRLKILGRPVEYVRYPGMGNDVAASASPVQRIDRLVRTYEFLTRFLDIPPSPTP